MTTKDETVSVKTVCGACGETAVEVLEKGMEPLPGKAPGQWHHPDGAGFIAKRKKARGKKIRALGAVPSDQNGLKSAEDDVLEAEDITLDEVKEFAEDFFGAKTLNSGTGNGLHVLHLEMKDGKVYEAYFDSATADLEGLVRLDASLASGEKSLDDEPAEYVSAAQAFDIALKGLQSELDVKSADLVDDISGEEFEGQDAWMVPVRTDSGADYDVFVALDGQVLGYDSYESEAKSADEDTEKKDDQPGVEVTSGDAGDDMTPESEKPSEEENAEEEDADEEKEEVVEEKSLTVDDPDFLASIAEFQALADGD